MSINPGRGPFDGHFPGAHQHPSGPRRDGWPTPSHPSPGASAAGRPDLTVAMSGSMPSGSGRPTGSSPLNPGPAAAPWDRPRSPYGGPGRGRREQDPIAAHAGTTAAIAGILGILAALVLQRSVGLVLSIVLGIAAVTAGAYSAANRRHTNTVFLTAAVAGIVLGLLAMLLGIGMAYSRRAQADEVTQGMGRDISTAPGVPAPSTAPTPEPSTAPPSAAATIPTPGATTPLVIGFGEVAGSRSGVKFEFGRPVQVPRPAGALAPDHIAITFPVTVRNEGETPYTASVHMNGTAEGSGEPLQPFISPELKTSNFVFGTVGPGATARTTAGFLVPPGTETVRISVEPGDRFPPFQVRGKVPD